MTRLTTLFSTAFVLMAASVASADTYDHFDRIARNIERQSAELVRETRHFRHTPQYRHLVADAAALARTARHAHATAHIGCDLRHLEADVRELDRLVHHLEDVLDAIEHGVVHGRGHVHGNAHHVHQLLHSIESNVHHLWDDLRSLRSPVRHNVGRTNPYWNQPSPYSQWRGPSARVQVEVDRRDRTRNLNPNAISRRVPAGWGNRSIPRFRFGFGF